MPSRYEPCGLESALQSEVRHGAGRAGDGRPGRYGRRRHARNAWPPARRPGFSFRAYERAAPFGGDSSGRSRPLSRPAADVAAVASRPECARIGRGTAARGVRYCTSCYQKIAARSRDEQCSAAGSTAIQGRLISREPNGSTGGEYFDGTIVSLAFIWHQHQPYYPDDVAGENPMPWVRLHGDQGLLRHGPAPREVPEFRCTINLVPSLLVQLAGLHRQGAQRPLISTSRGMPADGLSERSDMPVTCSTIFSWPTRTR